MADVGEQGGAGGSDSLVGAQLGVYVVEALLGRGAMGAVYRAVQVSLNRPVALKVMASHLVGSEEGVARFWREARAAAAINHPNLVQVYDFGEEGGTYFYAMELVEGLSLGAHLRAGERFTERECIEVGREVTLALRAAHAAGVIHRDLKPDNLMLTGEGVVKVADLGVARFRTEGSEDLAGSETVAPGARDMRPWDSLTMTGVGMGTPAFMSPEQIRAEKNLDHRSDFYALGATLFQLATCRVPFPARSAAEVLDRQLSAPVPRAREVNPALSDAFSELIVRLMAKAPDARPQTHEEILAALEGCLRGVRGVREETSRIQLADAPTDGWGMKLVRLWPVWAAAALGVGSLFLLRKPAGPEPWERLQQRAGREVATAPTGAVGAVASNVPSGTGAVQMAVVPAVMQQSAVAGSSTQMAFNGPMAAVTARGAVQKPVTPLFSAVAMASASKEKPLVNSLGMRFVPIPGTKVLFSIWETRVRDFDAFVRESGYNWDGKPMFEQGPDDPVVMVSWDDAKAFCDWLSKKEGLEYRLPTDEEWETAASGTDEGSSGDAIAASNRQANVAGEESLLGRSDDPRGISGARYGYRDRYPRTAPVGSYSPTGLGLHDMLGNVWEFCEDWFDQKIYKKKLAAGGGRASPTEVAEFEKGDVRKVLRGWSWSDPGLASLALSHRFHVRSERAFPYIGFRCAVVAPSLFRAGAETKGRSLGPSDAPANSRQPVLKISEVLGATTDRPFVNSLGMKFVPVPGTSVLFCVWETRVRDFGAFVEDRGSPKIPPPDFDQTPDDPMVMVSWNDANAFCDWLSKKEGLEYRLPTDSEWDSVVGQGKYPWGERWPPPAGAENIAGEESRLGRPDDPTGGYLVGYRDDHPRIAPVGKYMPNAVGLHDLGGNVREYVEDWFTEDAHAKHRAGGAFSYREPGELAKIKKGDVHRMSRGGWWSICDSGLLVSSARYMVSPVNRSGIVGFRCALLRPSPFSVLSHIGLPVAKEIDGILTPLREAKVVAEKQAGERIARYVNDLKEMEGKAKVRGDLDAVAKLREELEGWAAGRRIPKADGSVRMPSEYGNLRHFLDRDLASIDGRVEAAIKRGAPNAASSLRLIETRLTRSGEAEAALAVRVVREQVEKGVVPGTGEGEDRPSAVTPPTILSGQGGARPADAPTGSLFETITTPASATKEKPFVNSLGMRFVPVPGTKVLFSVWETRVKDFNEFLKKDKHTMGHKHPIESTVGDYPVAMINWDDARAFCGWLSKEEGIEYRLPTDEEWDVAVGQGNYPWGDDWPPPEGVENIAGEESRLGRPDDPKYGVQEGYRDEHPRKASVGCYQANYVGLYDMGGNVREFVEGWYTEAHYIKNRDGGGYEPRPEQMVDIKKGDIRRIARGGCWSVCGSFILASSCRIPPLPDETGENLGFRCVLVLP